VPSTIFPRTADYPPPFDPPCPHAQEEDLRSASTAHRSTRNVELPSAYCTKQSTDRKVYMSIHPRGCYEFANWPAPQPLCLLLLTQLLSSAPEVDAQRVGVKISPMHECGAFQANDETLPVTEYAIRKLSTYNLSHWLLMGNSTDFSGTPLEKLAGDGMFHHFRPLAIPQVLDSEIAEVLASIEVETESGLEATAAAKKLFLKHGRPLQEIDSLGWRCSR
jgi:hypothetical protein